MWLLKLYFSISVLCFLMYMGFSAVFKDKIKENGYLQEKKKRKLSTWLLFFVPVLNILLVITLFLMIGVKKDDLEKKSQKVEPYVEKTGECDVCKYRSICEKERCVIEITSISDTRRHFTRTRDAICRKEMEQLNDPT